MCAAEWVGPGAGWAIAMKSTAAKMTMTDDTQRKTTKTVSLMRQRRRIWRAGISIRTLLGQRASRIKTRWTPLTVTPDGHDSCHPGPSPLMAMIVVIPASHPILSPTTLTLNHPLSSPSIISPSQSSPSEVTSQPSSPTPYDWRRAHAAG